MPPLLLPLLCLVSAVLGLGQNATISFNVTSSSLALASGGSAVQVLADGADWPAVLRVANDLTLDFGRVTGTNGSLSLTNSSDSYNIASYNAGTRFSANPHDASKIFNITGLNSFQSTSSGTQGGFIIAGTIGNSTLIDQLISSGKIDVSAIQGTWEAFVSTIVSDPIPGVESALVIAGT